MEREIVELRAQLASQQASPTAQGPTIKAPSGSVSPNMSHVPPLDQLGGSEDAVASLMDLRAGVSFMKNPHGQGPMARRLGDIALAQSQVQELFKRSEEGCLLGYNGLRVDIVSSHIIILFSQSSIQQDLQTNFLKPHRSCSGSSLVLQPGNHLPSHHF